MLWIYELFCSLRVILNLQYQEKCAISYGTDVSFSSHLVEEFDDRCYNALSCLFCGLPCMFGDQSCDKYHSYVLAEFGQYWIHTADCPVPGGNVLLLPWHCLIFTKSCDTIVAWIIVYQRIILEIMLFDTTIQHGTPIAPVNKQRENQEMSWWWLDRTEQN